MRGRGLVEVAVLLATITDSRQHQAVEPLASCLRLGLAAVLTALGRAVLLGFATTLDGPVTARVKTQPYEEAAWPLADAGHCKQADAEWGLYMGLQLFGFASDELAIWPSYQTSWPFVSKKRDRNIGQR